MFNKLIKRKLVAIKHKDSTAKRVFTQELRYHTISLGNRSKPLYFDSPEYVA